MRLMSFKKGSGVALGLVEGSDVIDVADLGAGLPPTLEALIAGGDPALKRLQEARAKAASPKRVSLASVTAALPISKGSKLICLGLNYAEHAKEGGHTPQDQYPALFLRVYASLVPHGAPAIRPKASERFDYEAELVIVIGKGGRHISESKAYEHILGYTLFNDGSIRDYQRKTTQWTPGKNFESTGPLGPWVVTADELPAGAKGLRIQSRLNGQIMQDANTNDMIFPVARTIAVISEVMSLEPGDMIATGTPSGVGHARKPPVWMKHGDTIEIEVEKVGVLKNPVRDEGA